MADDEIVGRLLEALEKIGGVSDLLPTVDGVPPEDLMLAADTAEKLGYVRAKATRNANNDLFGILDVRLTTAGRTRLQEHRRTVSHGGDTGPARHLDSSLDSRRERRTTFIRILYEEAGGSESKFVDGLDLGDRLGWPRRETDDVMQYWEGEGFIWYVTEEGLVSLKHRGIVEIEHAMTEPAVPTPHFPANSIVIHGDVHGSQIMAGSPGSSQMWSGAREPDDALVVRFIEALQAALTDEPLEDPSQQLRTEQLVALLETELSRDEPDEGLSRTLLNSLRDFAIAVAASGAWVGVADLAHQLGH